MDYNPANKQLLGWYGKGYHFLNDAMFLDMMQTQVQNKWLNVVRIFAVGLVGAAGLETADLVLIIWHVSTRVCTARTLARATTKTKPQIQSFMSDSRSLYMNDYTISFMLSIYLLKELETIYKWSEISPSLPIAYLCVSIQIMNVNECDGTDILFSEAKLNRTFHLLLNEIYWMHYHRNEKYSFLSYQKYNV